jgi:hypothetical protein
MVNIGTGDDKEMAINTGGGGVSRSGGSNSGSTEHLAKVENKRTKGRI